MGTPWLQFGPFTGGIDNVNPVRSLTPDKLREGVDLDIDNLGYLDVRPSRTTVHSTASHSLWANKAENICLVAEGTTLRRLNADETRTTIRTGLTADVALSYDEINNDIYYSNGQIIERTDGYSVASFSTLFNADMTIEDRPFKRVMWPGTIIKFYNNRLYAIRGGLISFSDAYHFTSRDNRFCRIYVPANIVMFHPVTDGIWLAFGGKTYFMSGPGPEDFTLIEKALYGAIGQAVEMPKELVGTEGFGGRTIMWMSSAGACIGGDSGQMYNISLKKYQIIADAISASSYIRVKNKAICHFITSIKHRA